MEDIDLFSNPLIVKSETDNNFEKSNSEENEIKSCLNSPTNDQQQLQLLATTNPAYKPIKRKKRLLPPKDPNEKPEKLKKQNPLKQGQNGNKFGNTVNNVKNNIEDSAVNNVRTNNLPINVINNIDTITNPATGKEATATNTQPISSNNLSTPTTGTTINGKTVDSSGSTYQMVLSEQIVFGKIKMWLRNNPEKAKLLASIIEQKSEISIRSLEHLCTEFSHSRNIVIPSSYATMGTIVNGTQSTLTNDGLFNIRDEYCKQLPKSRFDFCRRGKRVFVEIDGRMIESTLPQLNCLMWVLTTPVYQYAVQHYESIKNDLNFAKGLVPKKFKNRSSNELVTAYTAPNNEIVLLSQPKEISFL